MGGRGGAVRMHRAGFVRAFRQDGPANDRIARRHQHSFLRKRWRAEFMGRANTTVAECFRTRHDTPPLANLVLLWSSHCWCEPFRVIRGASPLLAPVAGGALIFVCY